MEVVPGIYVIEGLSQVYLYEEADRLTLIDTGLATSAAAILSEIERIGRRPEDLRQIVVTHSHADHTGSLAELAARTGASVLAHALDAPFVRGDAPEPPPLFSPEEQALFDKIGPLVPPALPCAVDRELAGGEEIDLDGGAQVVHVPGHTPGSIAVYVPRRRALFSGDTAERDLEGNVIVGVFNVDPGETRRSFAKLAALDFDVACFGHGKPMDRDASLAFRRLAERLAR